VKFCGGHRPPLQQHPLAGTPFSRYILPMNRLTKQEQLVLCVVLGLLLTGWAVKIWRTAHPPVGTVQQVK
jgi:hypothetical protein